MANPTDQKEVLRLEGIEEHRLGKGTPFSSTTLSVQVSETCNVLV
jgi:hypothetical protein